MSETTIQPTTQAQMIIDFSDASIMSHVKALLKHVSGIEAVRIRRKKTKATNIITPELAATISEAEENMKKGDCVSFNSMDEFDAYFDAL